MKVAICQPTRIGRWAMNILHSTINVNLQRNTPNSCEWWQPTCNDYKDTLTVNVNQVFNKCISSWQIKKIDMQRMQWFARDKAQFSYNQWHLITRNHVNLFVGNNGGQVANMMNSLQTRINELQHIVHKQGHYTCNTYEPLNTQRAIYKKNTKEL